MRIDAKKLKETIVKNAQNKIKFERFYAVPNADGYSLSDYGRLVYGNKWVRLVRKGKPDLYNDYYRIKFNDKESESFVRIDKLVAMVFRPGEEIYCLVNFCWVNRDKGLFDVEKLHVIKNKAELVDYIRSKTEGIEPSYEGAKEERKFINRNKYNKDINSVIHALYWNARSRATNDKVKELNPVYSGVTMCDGWLQGIKPFTDWFLNNNYYYPERLELDKDLITFGTGKIYSPETCCLLPSKINRLFETRGSSVGLGMRIKKRADSSYIFYVGDGNARKTFYNYLDALTYTRSRKADNIRCTVKEEREKGYMPEYLLEKMSQWADLTEMGLIKMWEPDMETLIKEGII